MDGTIERDGGQRGQSVLCFEREYAAPIADVWNALWRSDHLKNWLSDGEPVIEPVIGGKVSLDVIESSVSEVDAPRLLAYDWTSPAYLEAPQGKVRFELEETGIDTRLRLRHTLSGEDPAMLAESLGAWHVMLDRLEALLAGTPRPWDDAEWQRWHDRYATALGEAGA